MLRYRRQYWVLCLFVVGFSCPVAAGDVSFAQKEIEEQIAAERGMEHVVIMQYPVLGSGEYVKGFEYEAHNRVRFDVMRASGVVEKVVASYKEAILMPSVKRAIEPGSVITSEDVEYIKMPKNAVNTRFVRDEEEILGLTTRKRLNPNKAINKNDIIPVILIEKGKIVRIIYSKGQVYIEGQGVAEESKGAGQMIKMVLKDVKTKVIGKVVDGETVALID